MAYDTGNGSDRTAMGVTPEQAVEALSAAGADVIGANCGQGVARFSATCRRLCEATDKPVWIKANAGMPEVIDGKAVYRTTADEFEHGALSVVEAGAKFVGGCCGTDSTHISALVRALAL